MSPFVNPEASPAKGAAPVGYLLCLCLLAGCAHRATEKISAPVPVTVPVQYRNAQEGNTKGSPTAGATATVSPRTPSSSAWWERFESKELNALMDRALAYNGDLKIATLQLAQAKVRADQAHAGLLPSLSAPLVVGVQAPGGQVGSVPVGTSRSQSQTSYQASLQGVWRADIWGEQRSLAESADQQVWRTVFERENVERHVLTNLTLSYVEYLSMNDRLEQAVLTEKMAQESLLSLERRVAAFDATLDDLEQHRASVHALRASILQLEQQREDARNSIAFLVGTAPFKLELTTAGLDSLKLPPQRAGLPSQLILKRPDIRMVEARMIAANADIQVARARLLPALDLSAQSGFSALSMGSLVQPQNAFWNLISNVTVSIFDGGRKAGDKAFSEAYYEEMVETYRRTIFFAIREVEGALVNLRQSQQRLQSQELAVVAARKSQASSFQMFQAGAIDQGSLLESRRSYHRYLEDYEHARMDFFKAQITLFQALGGRSADPISDVPGAWDRVPSSLEGPMKALIEDKGTASSTRSLRKVWELQLGVTPNASVRGDFEVELAGLYHVDTVAAVVRDLRLRFGALLAPHSLRGDWFDGVESRSDPYQAWYRLSVSRVPTREAAEKICRALESEQTGCKVKTRQEKSPGVAEYLGRMFASVTAR